MKCVTDPSEGVNERVSDGWSEPLAEVIVEMEVFDCRRH